MFFICDLADDISKVAWRRYYIAREEKRRENWNKKKNGSREQIVFLLVALGCYVNKQVSPLKGYLVLKKKKVTTFKYYYGILSRLPLEKSVEWCQLQSGFLFFSLFYFFLLFWIGNFVYLFFCFFLNNCQPGFVSFHVICPSFSLSLSLFTSSPMKQTKQNKKTNFLFSFLTFAHELCSRS